MGLTGERGGGDGGLEVVGFKGKAGGRVEFEVEAVVEDVVEAVVEVVRVATESDVEVVDLTVSSPLESLMISSGIDCRI